MNGKLSVKKGIKSLIKLFICTYRQLDFAEFGEESIIAEPYDLSNPKNIVIQDHVNIGSNSILYATNERITIKKYFVSANGLRIATGNHERRVGRFLASISEAEKNHQIGLDLPVTINEDVWAGFNVTIMAGVTIGRGCTLAAGSVVTRSTPPYSICAGVPAKFIKFYWNIDQILEHESHLYPSHERFTVEELNRIFDKYQN